MKALLQYLILPRDVSDRERAYLRRVNKVALAFFWAHVPVFAVIAYANDTGAAAAILFTSAVVVGPTILAPYLPPRFMAPVFGFSAMCLGGLLVHFGQGIAQIEMHFYFFVLLALLAVFGNPLAIVVAAVTVALHHALLWLLLPASVFNYEAPFWVVGIHATFVVIESVAACFVARNFFDNVIRLEKIIDERTRIIEERTRSLDKRNVELRRILDTVEQGLVVVDKLGNMSPEVSTALRRWLGPPQNDDGAQFFPWLARACGGDVQWLKMCFDALFDDVMPLEVSLAQMPREITVGERILALAVQVLPSGDAAMLSFTDVTAERAAAKSEDERREIAALFENVVRDRGAVAEFVEEGSALVAALGDEAGRAESTADARRIAHTLKGNASMFGLQRVVAAAHQLEDSIADDGAVDASRVASLRDLWNEAVGPVRELFVDDERLDVSTLDLDALIERVERGADAAELCGRLRALKDERGDKRLARLADYTRGLATRLRKDVEVHIECAPDVRVPSTLRPLWAATVHAVRNAVDHGIESCDERAATRKPATGRVTLALDASPHGDFRLTVADDGRGIDWSGLERAALEHGLGADLRGGAIAALFAPGVSTKRACTDISGRGIGMDALNAAVTARGGSIDVESTTGAGTVITMVIPSGR